MFSAFFERLRLRRHHGRNPLFASADALLREQKCPETAREEEELNRKVRFCIQCGMCDGFFGARNK